MVDSCAAESSSLVIFLATRLLSAKNHLPISQIERGGDTILKMISVVLIFPQYSCHFACISEITSQTNRRAFLLDSLTPAFSQFYRFYQYRCRHKLQRIKINNIKLEKWRFTYFANMFISMISRDWNSLPVSSFLTLDIFIHPKLGCTDNYVSIFLFTHFHFCSVMQGRVSQGLQWLFLIDSQILAFDPIHIYVKQLMK